MGLEHPGGGRVSGVQGGLVDAGEGPEHQVPSRVGMSLLTHSDPLHLEELRGRSDRLRTASPC